MTSSVLLFVIFLAGLTITACAPAGSEETEASTSSDSLDVSQVLDSLAELPTDVAETITKPLQQLSNNFKDTLFGSLFDFILQRLQKPLKSGQMSEEIPMFNQEMSYKTFVSVIQKLPKTIIAQSEPLFQSIITTLGESSELGKFLEEIWAILSMPADFLQAINPQAVMQADLVEKLPQNSIPVSRNERIPKQADTSNQSRMAAIMKRYNIRSEATDNIPVIPMRKTGSFVLPTRTSRLGSMIV